MPERNPYLALQEHVKLVSPERVAASVVSGPVKTPRRLHAQLPVYNKGQKSVEKNGFFTNTGGGAEYFSSTVEPQMGSDTLKLGFPISNLSRDERVLSEYRRISEELSQTCIFAKCTFAEMYFRKSAFSQRCIFAIQCFRKSVSLQKQSIFYELQMLLSTEAIDIFTKNITNEN